MSISGISGGLPPFVTGQVQRPEAQARPEGPGFADRMGDAVRDLAEAQQKASDSARAYELGQETDLASVMIDQQVSSLGFQMALNVRNKALGAYRDIMNMPV
jgi:flagellar hook-basal body complex protein FliE